MTTTAALPSPGGPAGGPGRPPLELRCLAMSRAVIYGNGSGPGSSGSLVWRWVTENGWSPIPDQWFGSPEEASRRFWEAVG